MAACGGAGVIEPAGAGGPLSFAACAWPTAVVGLSLLARSPSGCFRTDLSQSFESKYPDVIVEAGNGLLVSDVRLLPLERCDNWGGFPDEGEGPSADNAQGHVEMAGGEIIVHELVATFSDEALVLAPGTQPFDQRLCPF